MHRNRSKRFLGIVGAAGYASLLNLSAFAQIPQTGDGAGGIIPIMMGLLGVSIVLVIVYFVLSKRKK